MSAQGQVWLPPEVATFMNVPLFEGLSEDAIRALALATDEDAYARGQVILREGDFGDRLCVIGDGEVEVVKGVGSGHEVLLATLGPGEVFGEMSLIEGRPRSASIRAVKPSIIYSLTNHAITRFSRFWPEFHSIIIFNLAVGLSRRLREIDKSI